MALWSGEDALLALDRPASRCSRARWSRCPCRSAAEPLARLRGGRLGGGAAGLGAGLRADRPGRRTSQRAGPDLPRPGAPCRCSPRSRWAGSAAGLAARRALLARASLFGLAWVGSGRSCGRRRGDAALGAQLRGARRRCWVRSRPPLAGRGDRGDGPGRHGARDLRPAAAAQQRAERGAPRGRAAATAERRPSAPA